MKILKRIHKNTNKRFYFTENPNLHNTNFFNATFMNLQFQYPLSTIDTKLINQEMQLDDKQYISNGLYNSINVSSDGITFVDFVNSTVKLTNFDDMHISNSYFMNVDFDDVGFNKIQFRKCHFNNVVFDIVKFNEIHFIDCMFENVIFKRSIMINSIF